MQLSETGRDSRPAAARLLKREPDPNAPERPSLPIGRADPTPGPDQGPDTDAGASSIADPSRVRAAIAGDRAAMRAIWRDVRPWVVALVLAHKPREADPDDIVQDVAARFIAKVGSLDDPAAFPGWLRTVVINTARTAARRNATRRRLLGPRIPLETAAAPGAAPSDTPTTDGLVRDDERRALLDLVAELPEQYREAVLLKASHDLSCARIAELLGLTESAVESRLARARRMLRERWLERREHPHHENNTPAVATETRVPRVLSP